MTLTAIIQIVTLIITGILVPIILYYTTQQRRDKESLHERISNEQRRINIQSERLAGLEADRNSMKDQLNRMEKKLDSLIGRRVE